MDNAGECAQSARFTLAIHTRDLSRQLTDPDGEDGEDEKKHTFTPQIFARHNGI